MRRALLLSPLLLVAACASNGERGAPPPRPIVMAPIPADTPAAATADRAPPKVVMTASSPSPGRSVFFDFDQAMIRDDQAGVVIDQGKFAADHAGDHLSLQGNCDERGGAEYNLALGQRRADVVKERLILLGMTPDRIDAISYGSSQPRATCHGESCWSENRRVDFIHTARSP